MRNLQHEQFVKLQISYQTRIHALLDWNTRSVLLHLKLCVPRRGWADPGGQCTTGPTSG